MKTVTLGDYADVFNGKTPSKAEQRDRGHPVLKIRDVDDTGHFRREYKSFVDPDFVAKFQKKSVKAGDTLILNAAHNADYVGSKTFFADSEVEGAIATGEWLIVRPHRSALDARFASHWLTSSTARREIRELVKGIHLYPKDLARLSIPLPPLAEQKRIAAILDQADDLRRKRQRALDRLGQLGQAIFYEMFGDPTTNPMGWGMTQLGEIVRVGDRINYGVVQPGDEVESGVPLIRVGDLMKPFIDPSHVKHIDPAIESDYSRSRLIGDEILIGCVGSIGTVALAHPGLKGANIARAVARIPIDTSKIDRIFLAAMIKSPLVQRYFSAETRTVAQPTLNIGLIVRAPILLPPLETQQQFSLTLETLDPICTALGSSLVTIDKLFRSLQHRAFRGEL